MKRVSAKIRERLRKAGVSFKANDNISKYVRASELEQLQGEVELGFRGILDSLVIDCENDHNTADTAKRMASMFVNEFFVGRYTDAPSLTCFKNENPNGGANSSYFLGPITIRSTCSHHFVPILGQMYIALEAGDTLVGISKIPRLVNWVMARPHIQEEAVYILANELKTRLNPKGFCIYLKAQHMCMVARGVKESNSEMTNIYAYGTYEDSARQALFLDRIK